MWKTLWALINPFRKETSRGSFVSSHSSGAFQTAEATRQTTQGSTEEVAGRFSQCEPEVPRVRKARTCWQAGRAVPPARCHKSLSEGCSRKRAVLHHTWLLLNTSVCTAAWATPGWSEVGSHLYQQKENSALWGPSKSSQQTPVLITVVIFLPLAVFSLPCYQLLHDAVVQVILSQSLSCKELILK